MSVEIKKRAFLYCALMSFSMAWAGKKGSYKFDASLAFSFKAEESKKADTSHLYQSCYLQRDKSTELTTRFGTNFVALTGWENTEGYETTIMFLPFNVKRCEYTKENDQLIITGSRPYSKASLIVGATMEKSTYDCIDWGCDE